MPVDTMENDVGTHFNGAVPVESARTQLITTSQDELKLLRKKQAQKEYGRGKGIPLKNIKDKKLRGNLKSLERKNNDAALKAKNAEILLENEEGFLEPETALERTYKVCRSVLAEHTPKCVWTNQGSSNR